VIPPFKVVPTPYGSYKMYRKETTSGKIFSFLYKHIHPRNSPLLILLVGGPGLITWMLNVNFGSEIPFPLWMLFVQAFIQIMIMYIAGTGIVYYQRKDQEFMYEQGIIEDYLTAVRKSVEHVVTLKDRGMITNETASKMIDEIRKEARERGFNL